MRIQTVKYRYYGQAHSKPEVWDVSGKRKFASTEPKGTGNLKAELQIDGLPKGIYLYRLTENGVPVAVKRLAIE